MYGTNAHDVPGTRYDVIFVISEHKKQPFGCFITFFIPYTPFVGWKSGNWGIGVSFNVSIPRLLVGRAETGVCEQVLM